MLRGALVGSLIAGSLTALTALRPRRVIAGLTTDVGVRVACEAILPPVLLCQLGATAYIALLGNCSDRVERAISAAQFFFEGAATLMLLCGANTPETPSEPSAPAPTAGSGMSDVCCVPFDELERRRRRRRPLRSRG